MFARIRWQYLRCNAESNAATSSPVQHDVVRNYSASDGELGDCCAYCSEKIYGVKYAIGDRSDGVVHFGCIGLWQTRRSDEAFQIALGHELRSVKSHLKTHRRRLHVERWNTYRMHSKKNTERVIASKDTDAEGSIV